VWVCGCRELIADLLAILHHFSCRMHGRRGAQTALRAKRLRLYPDATQRNLLTQWFGTSRHVDNETVNHLRLPAGERARDALDGRSHQEHPAGLARMG
jgi:hypothetical protein